MTRRLALLLPLLLITACAGFGTKIEKPRLSLVGVQMLDSSLFEQRLQVRMRVINPNDMDIPVKGLHVKVELAGEDIATGVSARSFTVPRFGEAEFDMMVTANAATTLIKLATRGGLKKEAIDYRISGSLSTSLGFLRKVPFEETGKIRLNDLARPAVPKPDTAVPPPPVLPPVQPPAEPPV